MCLRVNKERTKDHSLVENEIYTFYKVFRVHMGILQTPIQGHSVTTKTVEADGGAIHAYVYEHKARIESCNCNICNDFVLPIKVHSNDIVAWGDNEDVCFFKYTFTASAIKILKAKGIELG